MVSSVLETPDKEEIRIRLTGRESILRTIMGLDAAAAVLERTICGVDGVHILQDSIQYRIDDLKAGSVSMIKLIKRLDDEGARRKNNIEEAAD